MSRAIVEKDCEASEVVQVMRLARLRRRGLSACWHMTLGCMNVRRYPTATIDPDPSLHSAAIRPAQHSRDDVCITQVLRLQHRLVEGCCCSSLPNALAPEPFLHREEGYGSLPNACLEFASPGTRNSLRSFPRFLLSADGTCFLRHLLPSSSNVERVS